jgi:hypothetical protein
VSHLFRLDDGHRLAHSFLGGSFSDEEGAGPGEEELDPAVWQPVRGPDSMEDEEREEGEI